MTTKLKLDELAAEAGVAPRTIRYYVQRGLMPAPAFHGRDTRYGPEHLLRLRAIKRLQEAHLPLDVIQARLAHADDEALRRMATLESTDRAGQPLESTDRAGQPLEHPPAWEQPEPCSARDPIVEATTERWERFIVAPGLELHVRTNAGHDGLALARKIKTDLLPSRS